MTADDDADRLAQLLDVGLQALKKGDGVGAELALKEALESAQKLPQRVICLPDRSGEAP